MSTAASKTSRKSVKAVKTRAKPGVLSKAKKAVEKIDWDAQFNQLKDKVDKVWQQGEHAAESAWHQTAVASLKWISEHQTRVDSFKKSVKGTVMEKPVNKALKAIRAEAKPKAATRKKSVAAGSKRSTRKPATKAVKG